MLQLSITAKSSTIQRDNAFMPSVVSLIYCRRAARDRGSRDYSLISYSELGEGRWQREKRYPAMTYSPAPLPGQYHRR